MVTIGIRSGLSLLYYRFAIYFIAATAFLFSARAQDVTMTARVDSSGIMIGDWFRLLIEMEYPNGATADNPVLPDSMAGFELIKAEEPVTLQAGERTRRSHGYILTSFDSGKHFIPAIRSNYALPGDSSRRFVETSPIEIDVATPAVDTTQDIKDVKPPLSVPVSFGEMIPYLIGVAAAGGLFWLIRYVIRKRKKGESLIPPPPPRPANELAIEALRSLESEKLWQRGKVKEYHSQLTDILRLYIENRFRIPALESTTDEVIDALGAGMIDPESRTGLKEILERADLVKFAKSRPMPDENDKSLAVGYKFVEETYGAGLASEKGPDGPEASR